MVFLTVIATFKTTFTSPLLLDLKAVTAVQGESLSFLENSHVPVSLPVGISSKLCELNIPKAKLIFFLHTQFICIAMHVGLMQKENCSRQSFADGQVAQEAF